jgi:hypothetical protein
MILVLSEFFIPHKLLIGKAIAPLYHKIANKKPLQKESAFILARN